MSREIKAAINAITGVLLVTVVIVLALYGVNEFGMLLVEGEK